MANPLENDFGQQICENNDDFFIQQQCEIERINKGEVPVNDCCRRSLQIDSPERYSGIAALDEERERHHVESEKIHQWRQDHENLIAHKDRESEKKRTEWLAQAKKELDEWDQKRKDQFEKTQKSNRAAEKQFVKDRDHHQKGSEWEQVAKLCDFTSRTKRRKDVSKMRSSLLHLKEHPRPVSQQLHQSSH